MCVEAEMEMLRKCSGVEREMALAAINRKLHSIYKLLKVFCLHDFCLRFKLRSDIIKV